MLCGHFSQMKTNCKCRDDKRQFTHVSFCETHPFRDQQPLRPCNLPEYNQNAEEYIASILQWVYYIGTNPNNVNTYNIFKIVNGTTVQLTPDEVTINPPSGFTISGAEPPPADYHQPFVTIQLMGSITIKDAVTPFSMQTLVSQRQIDI